MQYTKQLRRAADIMSKNIPLLTELETLDTGRPIRETEYDIVEGVECLRYYSGLVSATSSGGSYQFGGGSWGYTLREPLGVTLGIGAWNVSLRLVAHTRICIDCIHILSTLYLHWSSTQYNLHCGRAHQLWHSVTA